MGEPEMVADPSNDGKKCAYKAGVPNDGPQRTFKKTGGGATEEECSKACADDSECVAFSGIWGKWCIGCKEELSDKHDGAKAFKKPVSADAEAEGDDADDEEEEVDGYKRLPGQYL